MIYNSCLKLDFNKLYFIIYLKVFSILKYISLNS